MRLGYLFRKLGLPLWTFVGIGISAVLFNYLGTVLEMLVKFLLNLPVTFTESMPPVIVLFFPLAIVLGLVLLHRLWGGPGRTSGAAKAQPKGKKGLILMASTFDHAKVSIDYHQGKGTLERVWIICSRDHGCFGPGSCPEGEKIAAYCRDKGVEAVLSGTGISPDSAQDTYDYVNRVYRRGGFKTREIIADFTGGTKPMAVGMIMACLNVDRELQYISYNRDEKQSHGPFLVDYQHSAFDLVG